MAKKQGLGSVKRFGARYGRTTKHKFALIEKEQKKKHKCPYCNKLKVKRIFVGVWHCRGCNSKFTGNAYTPGKKTIIEKPVEEIEA